MSGTDVISSPQAGAQQLIFTDEIQALLEPEARVIDEITRAGIARFFRLISVCAFIVKRALFWLHRIALIIGAISLLVVLIAAMAAPKAGPGLMGCTIQSSGLFW
ncbi:MAG: hypothetical protein EPN97_08370 [Alphaproteobacteria bacterium]|nr:MAG: hypothetical protein EPN97_08370 [Alphaproteobacteria bacterium]